MESYSFVQTIRGSFVQQIEPAKDAMRMEEGVELFSTAFEQIYGLSVVDKLVLERFRIIFQAAKDYGPLLAHYEKWEKIEKQIEELAAAVAKTMVNASRLRTIGVRRMPQGV